MALAPTSNAPALYELKSATLTLIAVVLKSVDLDLLARELAEHLGKTPNFFSHDPVVIDLGAVRDEGVPDFAVLLPLLQQYKMVPVAARGGNDAQMDAALAAGLTEAPETTAPRGEPVEVVREVVKEVVKEVVREVPVPAAAATTVVVDKPLRSGQQVYAKGADLVVLAMVSHGAEVIADGSIHVYAPLRGKAIAGARGNTEARIFSTCLEPELISIAGIYRTMETPLPADIAGKPAQVRLEGEKMVMLPLNL